MNTHSRRAEVRAATRVGAGHGLGGATHWPESLGSRGRAGSQRRCGRDRGGLLPGPSVGVSVPGAPGKGLTTHREAGHTSPSALPSYNSGLKVPHGPPVTSGGFPATSVPETAAPERLVTVSGRCAPEPLASPFFSGLLRRMQDRSPPQFTTSVHPSINPYYWLEVVDKCRTRSPHGGAWTEGGLGPSRCSRAGPLGSHFS